MNPENSAIGIFDSGVGGLTVLKEIEKALPHESIIYFGDTARVPYGTKSAETIERYSVENALFLLEKNIKLLIIACNTASAYGLLKLKRVFTVPIVEVILPGAASLASATQNKKVAVLATKATVASEAYPKAIQKIDPRLELLSISCPLLTPMIEEGMLDHSVTKAMVKQYLQPIKEKGCDSVLLGCTHYPLIKNLIALEMGPQVQIIDSAKACALETAALLESLNLKRKGVEPGRVQFYVSDDPVKFQDLGRQFLGRTVKNVMLV